MFTINDKGKAYSVLFFLIFFTSLAIHLITDCYAHAAQTYTFGVVPQFEQRKLFSIWKPVLTELEKRTGFDFKIVTTVKIPDFEKRLSQGSLDFAYMNPYHLLSANPAQGYLPLVRDQKPLRGILVVRKDSPIKKLRELNGKVVAFPSPNAIGASLLMRADLAKRHKVNVIPLYVNTHSSVYLHVANHLVAAGGGVEKTLQEQEKPVRDALRILYTTRNIPSHPIAAHPRVPKEHIEKVRRALLDMAATTEGQKLLSKIPFGHVVPASIDDYAVIRDWGLDAFCE